jgi:hypothetical protein
LRETYCLGLQDSNGDAEKWRDLYKVAGRKNRYQLPMSLHGTKTQKKNINLNAVKTSNLFK